MAKTKIKDSIRLPDGRVMTLGEALDSGIATLRESTHYAPGREDSRGRPLQVTTYGAWVGDAGWEVGKTLYESRTGSVSLRTA